MPILKYNTTTLPKHKDKDAIIQFILDNRPYYSYEELIELVYMKYNFKFQSRRLLIHNLNIRNIKKEKNKVSFKTINIESIYRFIPDIERAKTAKTRKDKKESRYENYFKDKLKRLENIGKDINNES